MIVSVIIPVYNVERYIERCVRSLMQQTLADVEFLFIDDGSLDNSMSIVRQVTAEYNRSVRFLSHDTNKGLPAARNTGLFAATGKYIHHCDADDWMESTMLEKMVIAAEKNDADFVYCDLFLSFSEKERVLKQPAFTDPMTALEEGLLAGTMKHNVWNKLVLRNLYLENNLSSPENNSKGGEDLMVYKALRVARKIAYVPEALYHYDRTNTSAITRTRSSRHFEDIKANADSVLDFLDKHPIAHPEFLQFYKLDIKLPLLFSNDSNQYNLWKEWYPESNAFISKNKYLPARTRFIQHLAKMNLFSLIRFYSWTVDKLFYGLLYK